VAYVVGDPITARYEVRNPATGALTDATVVIAVTRPDGSTLTPAPTPSHPGAGLYDSTWQGSTAGVWRWTYTATGAVSDTTDVAVYVWPVGAVLPWVPTRRQAAKYVSERTISADQTSDAPLNDFTDATNPTGPQADEHIAAAVGWVTTRAGTVEPSLYAQATEVAAVRAAGMIELSYPVRQNDINTAQALLAQASGMLTALVDANEQVNIASGAPGLLSEYAFPAPPSWGDSLIW
jgi:hypothetical protein